MVSSQERGDRNEDSVVEVFRTEMLIVGIMLFKVLGAKWSRRRRALKPQQTNKYCSKFCRN